MSDLQRYGLEWKSETDFVCHPMADGYWTPWHIATEELTRLQSEVERLQADNDYQRERRTAARECIKKMRKEQWRKSDAEILLKQAEAVEALSAEPKRWEPGELFAYAQRLRQQADEAEKAGGEHG